MVRSHSLQQAVRLSLAASAIALSMPVLAQQAPAKDKSATTLGAVIVTAQKREESIQDVPIAVTALSQNDLAARGLDGGPNIVQAVPNVTFSKTNFTSFNLQIRGVGTKLIAGSGDQGVGIHMNNAPLTVSRFFEAEFYDVQRIEVLRGPQGTLYGRNATGGVFNVITAKPTDKFEGSLTVDLGNYNSRKVKAMLNLPLSDVFQLRLAGSFVGRDGFNYDPVYNTDVDGRDMIAGRATLAFKPSDSFNAYLLWEHFKEQDDRQRTGVQLCTKDPGPASVGGQPTTNALGGLQARWFLSQGCLPASIYSQSALGTINTNGALGGEFANLLGIGAGDMYAGQTISPNFRTTNSYYLPQYYAKSDIAELNIEIKPTDALTFTSLTSYNDDNLDSREDYNRSVPNVKFNTAAPLAGLLLQNGNLVDPQIGSTNTLAVYDKSFSQTKTWTEELRLQSAFDGPVNFNVGGIYIDLNSPVNGGYYVFFNTGTAYAECYNAGFCNQDPITGASLGVPAVPMYIDPNQEPNGLGHNYYLNLQSYKLRSVAGFGELYWQMTDTFKWTLGVRYTDDKKTAVSYDFNQQFIYPGQGFAPSAISTQEAQFKETTGRFGFDWKVGDDSMIYLFYSKGYKGGGFNPATAGNVSKTFDPEFVNALELGTKNTFADGRVELNATVFHYDYKGYQISRIVNLTSVNDNVDAKIDGAELEMAWQPLDQTRLDANIGYLKTKIDGGSAVDVMNRTQGDPSLTVIKGFSGTNCVAPTAAVATVLGAINAGLAPATTIPSICPSSNFPSGRFATQETRPGANYLGFTIDPTEGIPVSLKDKELPNAPHWTINVGAQQSFDLDDNWRGTFRVDYYHQTSSYARFFNTEFDRLKGWTNVNLSLAFDNDNSGWNWLVYVKNLLGDDNITDTYLTDDSSGLYVNAFLTDPRLIGISATKKF